MTKSSPRISIRTSALPCLAKWSTKVHEIFNGRFWKMGQYSRHYNVVVDGKWKRGRWRINVNLLPWSVHVLCIEGQASSGVDRTFEFRPWQEKVVGEAHRWVSCDGVSRISFEAIKLLGAKTWVAKLKDSMTLKSRDPKLFAMHAHLEVQGQINLKSRFLPFGICL